MKSDKKGRFLREEEHEWYDEEWDDEQEKRIWAACMRRHRLNLLEYGSPSSSYTPPSSLLLRTDSQSHCNSSQLQNGQARVRRLGVPPRG
jgi:hypothetical protein